MNKQRKRLVAVIGAVLLAIAVALAVSACGGNPNSNNVEHSEANAGIDQILNNDPVPIFTESQQRADMMEAEAIMALGTETTTFFFPQGTTIVGGKASAPPFKTCQSEGEPIPNTASLTNPEQTAGNNNDATIGQMDPDGLYTPSASDGTFVLCDDTSGEQKLSYWEGPVEAESGVAVWDPATGTIKDVGPSLLPVCTIVAAHSGDGTGLASGTRYYQCAKAQGDTSKGVQTKADYKLGA